jgi:hypothetical protein
MDTLVRKVLAEKKAIAEREEAERKQREAEERKRAEDAEAERITKLVAQYQVAKESLKVRERDLKSIDQKISALDPDMPALWSRWELFRGSRVMKEWEMEHKCIPMPGSPRPSNVPPPMRNPDGTVWRWTEQHMQRLNEYKSLLARRAPADALATTARSQVRQLEETEPALRVIAGAK